MLPLVEGREGGADQVLEQAGPSRNAQKRQWDAVCEPQEAFTRKRTRLEVYRPGVPTCISLTSFRFADKASPPVSTRPDDKDGHFTFELGDNLSSRYKILSKMGEGTFGRVLECWDRKREDYVAIKIVRSLDKYRHAAMIELEVLNTLEKNDPSGLNHCVALREWFDYRGHVCMVFERLGLSLFDYMRKNGYKPFPLDLVQDFGRQLLVATAYMHELRLVHTDLKPENILLTCQAVDGEVQPAESSGSSSSSSGRCCSRPPSSEIKVIDFGSATFEEQYHSCIVSTRHYRAPEVILGLGWSYPCDMWSIGCILIELITGEALFQTHENLEHLAMMEAVLGPLPACMATRCSLSPAGKYFNNATQRLNWPEGAVSRKSVKAVKRLSGLHQLLMEQGDPSVRSYTDELVSLITAMLRYEPSERMTAQQALAHPFFARPLSGTTPTPVPAAAASGPGSVPPVGVLLAVASSGALGGASVQAVQGAGLGLLSGAVGRGSRQAAAAAALEAVEVGAVASGPSVRTPSVVVL